CTTEFDATRKRGTKPIPSLDFCRVAWNPSLPGSSYDSAKQTQFSLKLKNKNTSIRCDDVFFGRTQFPAQDGGESADDVDSAVLGASASRRCKVQSVF